MSETPLLRGPRPPVLVAVALVSGAILLLGDRFDPDSGYALTQAGPGSTARDRRLRGRGEHAPDRHRPGECRPGELTLVEPLR